MCDYDMLVEQGIEIPAKLEGVDELQANIWICNGKLLRMVLNPFKPATIPYMAAPYELNPTQFLWCRYCRKHGRYSDTYEWVYAYGCR